MRPVRIAGIALVAALAVCILSGIYFFFISPEKENHWAYVRARGRVAYFSVSGMVKDQYGKAVPNYDIGLALYPGGMSGRRWEPFTTTDAVGRFHYSSAPLKIMAAIVGGKGYQSNDGQYYAQIPDMGGYFIYQGKEGWIWRYDPQDPWKKLEPSTQFVYRIGHMGPPERMIKFTWDQWGVPLTNDYRSRVNLLTGKMEPLDCNDCDFELRVRNAETASGTDGASFTTELIGLNGAALLLAKDPFLHEAPHDGYISTLTLQSRPRQPNWQPGTGTINLYFKARNGQVYGRMAVAEFAGKDKRLSSSVQIVANPRSSRNLNDGDSLVVGHYREPLPLPVVLPFVEPPR